MWIFFKIFIFFEKEINCVKYSFRFSFIEIWQCAHLRKRNKHMFIYFRMMFDNNYIDYRFDSYKVFLVFFLTPNLKWITFNFSILRGKVAIIHWLKCSSPKNHPIAQLSRTRYSYVLIAIYNASRHFASPHTSPHIRRTRFPSVLHCLSDHLHLKFLHEPRFLFLSPSSLFGHFCSPVPVIDCNVIIKVWSLRFVSAFAFWWYWIDIRVFHDNFSKGYSLNCAIN